MNNAGTPGAVPMGRESLEEWQRRNIRAWCEEHGWNGLHREGGVWVACPPQEDTSVPVPIAAYQARVAVNRERLGRILWLAIAMVRLAILSVVLAQFAYLAGVCWIYTHTSQTVFLSEWSIFRWTSYTPSTFPMLLLMVPLFASIAILLGERLWVWTGRMTA
ncbi:gll2519 [Gloeobacter violaceus PCC 7421]|uniref:Gll2519 protein n=2 Tax=Gloeobacter violaceus TaxID=33072 RepID=Q7NHL6_GLOVI|nr:gll2519 [Gloeobacter violaceus PCC 7421]